MAPSNRTDSGSSIDFGTNEEGYLRNRYFAYYRGSLHGLYEKGVNELLEANEQNNGIFSIEI